MYVSSLDSSDVATINKYTVTYVSDKGSWFIRDDFTDTIPRLTSFYFLVSLDHVYYVLAELWTDLLCR